MSEIPSHLLADPAVPKRFDGLVRLTTASERGRRDRTVHRRVVACTWSEAREQIERVPWEDHVADDEDLLEVEVTMGEWAPEG